MGTNCSEVFNEKQNVPFKKMCFKTSSEKMVAILFGLNVLK